MKYQNDFRLAMTLIVLLIGTLTGMGQNQQQGREPTDPVPGFQPGPPEGKITPGQFFVDPPTIHNLGFRWYIEGDTNRNASVDVAYRRKGEEEWREALPLLRVQHEIVNAAYNPWRCGNLFAGSVNRKGPTMTRPANDKPKTTRRELLGLGIPALAGTALCPRLEGIAEAGSAAGPDTPVDVPWPRRRATIERAWLDLLGDFPEEIPALQPEMRVVAEEHGVTRYHVRFQSEADDQVTAWLLVPQAARTRRTPAIICIHSTTWGSGKDSTIGLSGRRPVDPPHDPQVGAASGRDLARHGFITLSIDLLTDGERIDPGRRVMDTRGFYLKHPDWSIVGKNTWDVMRGVDFLQTLDFVDADQIGVIGWSLGGHSALFAAAFEPRITAAVSNGGVLDWHRHVDAWSRQPETWVPWKEGDPPTNNPELERRFGFKTNSGPYIYIKKFRPYIDDPDKPIPVGFAELMMMVAPRPLLIISTEQEFYRHKVLPKCLEALQVYVNWRDVEGMPSVVKARQERLGYEQTLEYYEREHLIAPDRIPGMFGELGAADCFSWFSFPGGHGFPGVARRHVFAWYDRWLGRSLE